VSFTGGGDFSVFSTKGMRQFELTPALSPHHHS
jgi:hypothetical protein